MIRVVSRPGRFARSSGRTAACLLAGCLGLWIPGAAQEGVGTAQPEQLGPIEPLLQSDAPIVLMGGAVWLNLHLAYSQRQVYPPTTPDGAPLPGAACGRGPAVPTTDIDVAYDQDAPSYVKGERVVHAQFGSGTIREISGFGRDTKVTVDFDDEEIGRVAWGADAPFWGELDAALIRSVDELVGDGAISAATWATLAAELDTAQVLDVIFTVGAYRALATMMRSFELELDDDLRGEKDVTE